MTTNEEQAAQLAQAFRAQNHLSQSPVEDLIGLSEELGYDVAVVHASENEHGMAGKDPESGAIFILLPTTSHPMRQRSSLAHELCHILLEEWHNNSEAAEQYSKRDPAEIKADAFARHLLIPQEGIKRLFTHRTELTEQDLSRAVQNFLVSPQIAAIALEQAGLISPSQKASWMNISAYTLSQRYGWVDQYKQLQHNSQQPKTPQSLLARAVRGYELGVVDIQVIATLRGISKEDLLQEFEVAEIHVQNLIEEDSEEINIPSSLDEAELERLLAELEGN